METCPCCGYPMVRYFHHHQLAYFCHHCWQEIPDLTIQHLHAVARRQLLKQDIQKHLSQKTVLEA